MAQVQPILVPSSEWPRQTPFGDEKSFFKVKRLGHPSFLYTGIQNAFNEALRLAALEEEEEEVFITRGNGRCKHNYGELKECLLILAELKQAFKDDCGLDLQLSRCNLYIKGMQLPGPRGSSFFSLRFPRVRFGITEAWRITR